VAEELGATLVPPYDHPVDDRGARARPALELLGDIPDLDALVVPVGGGGLISGCSIAAKAMRPNIRIFGVEPEDGNDTFLSLRAGQRTQIPPPQTMADGLRSAIAGRAHVPPSFRSWWKRSSW